MQAGAGQMKLAQIETIVVIMLENRSFDHMLGYLSLDETASKLSLDGLRSDPKWRNSYDNLAAGKHHSIRRLSAIDSISKDPPHGRSNIDMQINTAPAGPGPAQMGGFAQSFLNAHPETRDPGAVMGYYDGDALRT